MRAVAQILFFCLGCFIAYQVYEGGDEIFKRLEAIARYKPKWIFAPVVIASYIVLFTLPVIIAAGLCAMFDVPIDFLFSED